MWTLWKRAIFEHDLKYAALKKANIFTSNNLRSFWRALLFCIAKTKSRIYTVGERNEEFSQDDCRVEHNEEIIIYCIQFQSIHHVWRVSLENVLRRKVSCNRCLSNWRCWCGFAIPCRIRSGSCTFIWNCFIKCRQRRHEHLHYQLARCPTTLSFSHSG